MGLNRREMGEEQAPCPGDGAMEFLDLCVTFAEKKEHGSS